MRQPGPMPRSSPTLRQRADLVRDARAPGQRRVAWRLGLWLPEAVEWLPLEAGLRRECDAALATDLMTGLWRRHPGPPPWTLLARPGGMADREQEAPWIGAARRAAAQVDQPLRMLVITAFGWYDVVSGEERSWARVRRP